MRAAEPYEFLVFGEMHLVQDWRLLWRDCSQTIGIHMVWWDASCSLPCSDLVSMQPRNRNSYGLVRCIMFPIEALCGVSAAKPYEFLGFGEMHLFFDWSLMWCECSQTTWIPKVWGDSPCFRLKPYMVWVQPKHIKSQGLGRCTLFSIEALCGVSAAKPCEILGHGEMHLVFDWSLMWCECSQTIWIPRVWGDAPCFRLKPYVVWVKPNHMNS